MLITSPSLPTCSCMTTSFDWNWQRQCELLGKKKSARDDFIGFYEKKAKNSCHNSFSLDSYMNRRMRHLIRDSDDSKVAVIAIGNLPIS